ncbi:hypothetical protein [Streptomyces griseus]|uniref:hypothetical protein n=1 Tax=Streptomyces griseus TaxID=1911 RepID=UPI0037B6F9F6
MRTQNPRTTRSPGSELLPVVIVLTSWVIGLFVAGAALSTVLTTDRFGVLRFVVAAALLLLTVVIAECVLHRLIRPLHYPMPTALSGIRPVPSVIGPVPSGTRDGARRAAAFPATAEEALPELSDAAVKDAESRAAIDSFIIDRSRYLEAAGWRGYPAGDATLLICPGTVLHFHSAGDHLYASFTLYTSDSSTPVPIKRVSEIWEHLSRNGQNTDSFPIGKSAAAEEVSPRPAPAPLDPAL